MEASRQVAAAAVKLWFVTAAASCVNTPSAAFPDGGTGAIPSSTGAASTATADVVDESSDGEIVELAYLQVEPEELVLEVDLATPTSQVFSVSAVYTDGSVQDVTADATWEVSNSAIGVMLGRQLQLGPFADSTIASILVTATVGDKHGRAQVTVAAYRRERDFFFVLPYLDPEGPSDKPLTFSTSLKSLDVFLNVDTTDSMDGALVALRESISTTIVPGIQNLVADTQFGVGSFQDFPVLPYGLAPLDQPFRMIQEVTDDIDAVQQALAGLSIAGGVDGPESHYEALYQIATGEGLDAPPPTNVPANHSGIGGVGFRQGSLPIIVSTTNAPGHDTVDSSCGRLYEGEVAAVAHSREQALAALHDICGRVVQIATTANPSPCTAQADGELLAEQTGAVIPPEAWDLSGRPAGCASDQCCTGLGGTGTVPNGDGMCPVVYLVQSDGTGVDSSVSSAIQLLSAYGRFDVTSQIRGKNHDEDGELLPEGTSTADFVKGVIPFAHGAVPLPGVPEPILGASAFEGVIPNTDVVFEVRGYNDFVPQTNHPRLFVTTIEVLADDCGDLDQRDVLILVPPSPLPPPQG